MPADATMPGIKTDRKSSIDGAGRRLAVTLAFVVTVLMMFGAAVVLNIVTADPAAALCAESDLEGDWHNINSDTDSMTRVVIETCESERVCEDGVCTIRHDAATYMTPYGACSPSDCNWGREKAEHKSDGWIKTTHDFGFKTSHVWAKTYDYYGRTYLRLWVYNDFSSADGRSDYTTDEWFLK